jgi:hypothetical protein
MYNILKRINFEQTDTQSIFLDLGAAAYLAHCHQIDLSYKLKYFTLLFGLKKISETKRHSLN